MRPGHVDEASVLEVGESPADRSEGEAEIIGNVGARHLQADRPSVRGRIGQLQQEGGDALARGLASKGQQAVIGDGEGLAGDLAETAADGAIGPGEGFGAALWITDDDHVGEGFRAEPIGLDRLEAEKSSA